MENLTKCYCGHTTYCDCGPETLEEAAERLCPNKQVEYDMFIEGAKWQQERSYSEEEVKDIVEQTIEKFYKHFYTLTKAEMKEQLFEQFKKK
jgi:hypothetical protein